MTVTVGTRLGPYEVLALLGRGGMGEVFRARDTRLNRDVAIKVLPQGVANKPRRRERFEREAQAISRLSHPHIRAIYDVGNFDDTSFLVMEYVDGESLERWLRRGPLPWKTALPWAIQIASALDAAHRHGIVHRDLKPANIVIGQAGVKLLDFGLAKLRKDFEATPPESVRQSTTSLTTEQQLLGTIHYMSPEQLDGREIDPRTDIFAFGTVLYEMLTGRRAFDGTTTARVAAAVLTSDAPSLTASTSGAAPIPEGLDHVVRRAIEKEPDARWQTARDVAIELEWIRDGRAQRTAAVAPARQGWRRSLALAIGGAVILVAAGGSAGWMFRPKPAIDAAEVFEISPPEGTTLAVGVNMIRVSRDGRQIAFLTKADESQLFVRNLGSSSARSVPDAVGVSSLIWSPDGRFIACVNGARQLIQVDVADGTRKVLADLPPVAELRNPTGVWLEHGPILLSGDTGLYRFNPAGGSLERLSSGPAGMVPSELPSSRFMTLMHGGARDMAFLVVRSIDGAELARLSTVMSNAVYAERHLVFRQGDALVAQPFDERRLQLTGHPVVLAPSVQFNSGNDRTAFSVGGDTLAYRAARPFRLTWRDRQGVVQGYVGEPDAVFNPAIAPDATGRVALDLYDRSTKRFNIAILDDRGRLTRLTNGIEERFPVWSPDSQWIAFRDSSEHSLKRVRVDGSGRFETLASGALIPLDWSKDGKVLLYVDLSAQGLWALPLPTSGAAPGSPVRVADSTAGVGASAAFSPDGRWVAYMTSVGETGVWIQSFPDGAIKRRVTASGSHPVWGADSRELSYFAPDGTLMSMPITLDPAPAGGRPVALFKARSPSPSLYPHAYAASADGRRFLVTEMADDSDRITVILHWPALVR